MNKEEWIKISNKVVKIIEGKISSLVDIEKNLWTDENDGQAGLLWVAFLHGTRYSESAYNLEDVFQEWLNNQ